MRAYLRDFWAEVRELLRELAADRNYLGVGLVVLCLPLIFVSDLIVQACNVGPE